MPLCLETRKHANVSRFSDLLQQKRCDWISSRGYQQRDLFRARGMTFLEDALSLPGLSLELLFQLKDQDTSFLFCSITNTQTYTLGSNKILWVARPLFGTDWPSKTKQKFAHMITLMPKQLKQTWGMTLPRCIDIAWGKTCPLATFTDGGRSAILGWKKAVIKAKLRWTG